MNGTSHDDRPRLMTRDSLLTRFSLAFANYCCVGCQPTRTLCVRTCGRIILSEPEISSQCRNIHRPPQVRIERRVCVLEGHLWGTFSSRLTQLTQRASFRRQGTPNSAKQRQAALNSASEDGCVGEARGSTMVRCFRASAGRGLCGECSAPIIGER